MEETKFQSRSVVLGVEIPSIVSEERVLGDFDLEIKTATPDRFIAAPARMDGWTTYLTCTASCGEDECSESAVLGGC